MDKSMQKYLDKAEVLIEALPYIQRFNRKVIVVKYGGSAMVDEELKKQVIEDVTLLKLVGFKPIIVHGGGKEISRWVSKVGMEPKFINGLRVTDEATMELAEMVLGKVNKELVQLVQGLGVRAIGISGKDGGLLKVTKKYSGGEDIGFVGEVQEVNAAILWDLLEKDSDCMPGGTGRQVSYLQYQCGRRSMRYCPGYECREAGVSYGYRRRVQRSEESGDIDF